MQEVIRFALLGFGVGSLYALAALGLIVIYRGSGVLNFALGAIGMAGAYLWYELRVNPGRPFAAAPAAPVFFSMTIGLLPPPLLMRPLRRGPPLAARLRPARASDSRSAAHCCCFMSTRNVT